MKRIVDLVVGLSALVMLVVPIVMVAILVKLTSKGSVLYWSDRVGQANVIFKMPKFRSMLVNTPQLATHLMIDPDEYLSLIGTFLRRTSLDELPQLINILKRDMSFVGPRPLTREVLLSKNNTSSAYKRSSVLPGLTGYTQAKYTGSRRSFAQKLKIDLEYVDKKTCPLLFKILFMTVKVLFVRFKHNKTGETL